jgi:hypothetical protein
MEKKTYEAPALKVHGSVEDLTKGSGLGFSDLFFGNGTVTGTIQLPGQPSGGSDLGS